MNLWENYKSSYAQYLVAFIKCTKVINKKPGSVEHKPCLGVWNGLFVCSFQDTFENFRLQGLSGSEVRARLLEYGENLIKISVPPVLHLVIHEGLNPFFLFQGLPTTVWKFNGFHCALKSYIS